MIEEWKPVKNYEGLYEVSSLGRIKSLRTGRFRKPYLNLKGYEQICLYKGKNYIYKLHRLVLQAFGECPEGKTQVNHKNGNKRDNRLENLEWVTASENVKHAYKMGLKIPIKGEDHRCSKLTLQEVGRIREKVEKGGSQYKIAEEFGVNHTTINRIIRKLIWNS